MPTNNKKAVKAKDGEKKAKGQSGKLVGKESGAMLTQKQEAFCAAYIETGNASEAYRRAYDASGMADTSVNRKAKELLDNGKITARVTELRAPVVKRAQITLERHLEDLKRLRDMAEASEKYGPAIQAEIARGKASGLYVERTELTGKDGAPITIKNAKDLTDDELAAIAARGSARAAD